MTVVLLDPSLSAPATLDQPLIRAFLDGIVGPEALPQPAWGPIGPEVYERTYSRDVPTEDGDRDGEMLTRKETWPETVRRVVCGNLGYAPQSSWLPGEDIELFDLMFNFRALPAGRHLWVTGTPVAGLSRNCWCAGWAPRTSDHFRFLAARLFEGGGVGANYSAELIAPTSPIAGQLTVTFTCDAGHADRAEVLQAAGIRWAEPPEGDLPVDLEVIAVPDTREGWVGAWARMIDLSTVAGHHPLLIDVSDLRPFGSPLRTFGGQASGPAPFVRAAVGILEVLAGAAGRQLTGLEAMAMDHEIATSVVAGGTRRSARIALMHWRDPEIFDFIGCKANQMQHWSTNISVEIDDDFRSALTQGDPHADAVLAAVVQGMITNGEPGLVDTDLVSRSEPRPLRACNPCGESFLDTNGAEGESCNLGSVNLEAFGDDFGGGMRAFQLMSRFLYRATLQPHHDPSVGHLEAGNRRIGVGIMGLQGWVAAHGYKLSELASTPDLCGELTRFAMACRSGADELADRLGTPRSVKVTAVAPTGTIAQLSGTTPGIHPVFARYFIRRVRFSDTDPKLAELADRAFEIVPDIYAERTSVASFSLGDAILDRYDEGLIEQADELSAGQFFALVAAVQQSFCGGTDGQAVSATAQIPADTDPAALQEAIRGQLGQVKGLTVFPEVSRALAPYQRLTQEEYQTLIEKLGGARATDTGDSNDGACRGGACPIR